MHGVAFDNFDSLPSPPRESRRAARYSVLYSARSPSSPLFGCQHGVLGTCDSSSCGHPSLLGLGPCDVCVWQPVPTHPLRTVFVAGVPNLNGRMTARSHFLFQLHGDWGGGDRERGASLCGNAPASRRQRFALLLLALTEPAVSWICRCLCFFFFFLLGSILSLLSLTKHTTRCCYYPK